MIIPLLSGGYDRYLAPRIAGALRRSPVVLIVGARQVGKSTLARSLGTQAGRRYITLDDLGQLSLARSDPAGFIDSLRGPVTIDEVQRAPDLLLAIKAAVDRDRTPGRFLLTGSADVLMLPAVSETLAGRMEVFTLWPLSESEIASGHGGFVDAAFSGPIDGAPPGIGRERLIAMLVRGGYPEVIARAPGEDREAWFRGYVETVVQREVAELSQLERLADIPRALTVLAGRAGGLLNLADISRSLAIPYTTLRRYLALLEHTFLIRLVLPWSTNMASRVVKSPKITFGDSGLLAYLQGIDEARLHAEPHLVGPVLESFVVGELTRQIGWSERRPQLMHLRTAGGLEVDVVMEDRAGRLVAIEVKATATPRPADMKGLRRLSESAGDRLVQGILLHTGAERIALSERLVALPISALWETPVP